MGCQSCRPWNLPGAEAQRDGAGYLFWSVYKPNTLARGFYDNIRGKSVDDLDFMTLSV